jgi:hydrogenase maturation protease
MNNWECRMPEELFEEVKLLECADAGAIEFRPGDRVRLKPRPGGDVIDIALAGRAAVIEAVEQDYEGRVQLAVIVDDDPGKDLGMLRQPGHRFFFAPEEVEPASPGEI